MCSCPRWSALCLRGILHSWIPDGSLHHGHVDGPLIVHILLNQDEAILIGEPIQHSIHAVSCEDGVHIIANIEDKVVAIHGQQRIVHLELSHTHLAPYYHSANGSRAALRLWCCP